VGASPGRMETQGIGSYPWFSIHHTLYHRYVCHSESCGNYPVSQTHTQQGKWYIPTRSVRLLCSFLFIWLVSSHRLM
jgi:hypothetical protein